MGLGTANGPRTFKCAPCRHAEVGKVSAQNTLPALGCSTNPWRCKKSGSAIQPVRRAVPQLIPKGLGTHFHPAVARDTEHLFLRPPTTYNPVAYATRYALQSERDCIAQRLNIAETPQELSDAVYSEKVHALRLVDPFLLPVVACPL